MPLWTTTPAGGGGGGGGITYPQDGAKLTTSAATTTIASGGGSVGSGALFTTLLYSNTANGLIVALSSATPFTIGTTGIYQMGINMVLDGNGVGGHIPIFFNLGNQAGRADYEVPAIGTGTTFSWNASITGFVTATSTCGFSISNPTGTDIDIFRVGTSLPALWIQRIS